MNPLKRFPALREIGAKIRRELQQMSAKRFTLHFTRYYSNYQISGETTFGHLHLKSNQLEALFTTVGNHGNSALFCNAFSQVSLPESRAFYPKHYIISSFWEAAAPPRSHGLCAYDVFNIRTTKQYLTALFLNEIIYLQLVQPFSFLHNAIWMQRTNV